LNLLFSVQCAATKTKQKIPIAIYVGRLAEYYKIYRGQQTAENSLYSWQVHSYLLVASHLIMHVMNRWIECQ